jgi:tyrosyl-tRNA synthetase
VVALVHGEPEVAKCEEVSAALFGQEIAGLSEEMLLAVTEDAPTTEIARQEILDGLPLVDALVRAGLVSSKGEARRTLQQQGASVNNMKQSDPARTLGLEDLLHDRYIVLRKGRRDIHVLTV